MLIGLVSVHREGETVILSLHFDESNNIDVIADVRKML